MKTTILFTLLILLLSCGKTTIDDEKNDENIQKGSNIESVDMGLGDRIINGTNEKDNEKKQIGVEIGSFNVDAGNGTPKGEQGNR